MKAAYVLKPGDSSTVPAPALAGLRLLLVEDDDAVRLTTAMLLQDDGAAVTEAVDGPSALALLHSGIAVDLMVSDVTMPGGLNGFELVREARRLRPGLPCVLVSGYVAPVGPGGQHQPSAARLIRKPYRQSELTQAIAEALGLEILGDPAG